MDLNEKLIAIRHQSWPGTLSIDGRVAEIQRQSIAAALDAQRAEWAEKLQPVDDDAVDQARRVLSQATKGAALDKMRNEVAVLIHADVNQLGSLYDCDKLAERILTKIFEP